MLSYTDAMIRELVACRKEIIEAPKKTFASIMGNKRNGMIVQCEGRRFRVFMRICEAFEENFSIGMEYLPAGDSSLMLIRCNGPHGEVLGPDCDPDHPHWGFHVHRAKKAMIDKGRRPEAGADLTTEYNSFNEAVRYFLKETNIVDALKHFPDAKQTTLFGP